MNVWLTSSPDGWLIGTPVIRLPEARAYGAYRACTAGDPRTHWVVAQVCYRIGNEDYDCMRPLYECDGWRSQWPDLVRLSWSQLPAAVTCGVRFGR